MIFSQSAATWLSVFVDSSTVLFVHTAIAVTLMRVVAPLGRLWEFTPKMEAT